jgi:hypothetical protein
MAVLLVFVLPLPPLATTLGLLGAAALTGRTLSPPLLAFLRIPVVVFFFLRGAESRVAWLLWCEVGIPPHLAEALNLKYLFLSTEPVGSSLNSDCERGDNFFPFPFNPCFFFPSSTDLECPGRLNMSAISFFFSRELCGLYAAMTPLKSVSSLRCAFPTRPPRPDEGILVQNLL